ncbi:MULTISPECIES: hypothetical protein [Rhizobium/Agrobacterium group]|uniref:Lipoprotein n=1 Tax=Neorhizobium petrolearium TaxID=515361 RepID=A0ABY8M1A2_9HYPH|nr:MULTISPECIES: hypothetical protein [Rhizobium/Agrobacterium group]MCC2613251.1 hypothetical protein [Neorhizobium petrolearium]WGI68341.1 hypothetical protein QEO92_25855 [Neorhizobium petrolearium]
MFSNIFRNLGVVVICIGLASCTTEKEFKELAAALKSNPGLRAKAVEKCVGKPIDWNAEMREALGWFANSADAKTPRIVCQRYVNAIASGRLSYKDVRSFSQGELTPTMARVLRGS